MCFHHRAQFNENMFPFSGTTVKNDASNLEISTFLEVGLASAPALPPAVKLSTLPVWSSLCTLCPDPPYATMNSHVIPPAHPPPVILSLLPPPPVPSSSSSHPMVTRARVGIFKPRYPIDISTRTLLSAHTVDSEPRDFKSASKYPEWLAAIQEEIDALRSNQT